MRSERTPGEADQLGAEMDLLADGDLHLQVLFVIPSLATMGKTFTDLVKPQVKRVMCTSLYSAKNLFC